jgi:hypothetical protein
MTNAFLAGADADRVLCGAPALRLGAECSGNAGCITGAVCVSKASTGFVAAVDARSATAGRDISAGVELADTSPG